MSEQNVREKIAAIDEKRQRAKLLARMAEWPMWSPSKVTADKRRGVFRWFGSVVEGASAEVELTRDERSELRDWLIAKSTRLAAEADEVSATLAEPLGGV